MADIEVARVRDIPEGGMKQIEAGAFKCLLVRLDGMVHALEAECPHARAPLAEGAVCNGRLVCPWHMGTFRVADGALVEPPAMRGLQRYAVRIDGDAVLVDPAPLDPAPALRAARDPGRVVLVGAGAAAAMAAETLREGGFAGAITMIGPHAEEPIDRTLLSKQAMAGQWELGELGLWDGAATARLGIERVLGTVISLDAEAREIGLQDGRRLAYDSALLATGGVPRPLPLPGAALPGVFLLRHRSDLAAILEASAGSGPAVVIGSSFIGMEAAGALVEKGLDVTVIGAERAPFAKQFGPDVAAAIRRLHERSGARLHLGAKVARLVGSSRVAAVELESGERVPAGLVVVGIGVRPATGFVSGVRKQEDGGILVDAAMRAALGLYAAGDVAAFPWPGAPVRVEPIRVEHWRVAQQHGRIAAFGMLGAEAPSVGVPFFWTAQHGKRIDYLGHASDWDEITIDGDLDAFDFIAWYVRGGRVAAVLSCARETEMALLAELMREPPDLATARARIAARR